VLLVTSHTKLSLARCLRAIQNINCIRNRLHILNSAGLTEELIVHQLANEFLIFMEPKVSNLACWLVSYSAR
jgi:hypothetical protein